jgi:hypothetical protein
MGGRRQQSLELNVEIPSDCESWLTPIRSEQARHRVIGQVHTIGTLVDENR